MVMPPTCVAAIPVDAVIATEIFLERKYETYVLMVYVFPAPGSPVKKTVLPVFKMFSAWVWVIGERLER